MQEEWSTKLCMHRDKDRPCHLLKPKEEAADKEMEVTLAVNNWVKGEKKKKRCVAFETEENHEE